MNREKCGADVNKKQAKILQSSLSIVSLLHQIKAGIKFHQTC